MKDVSYILLPESMCISIDNVMHTIGQSHPNYHQVQQAIKEQRLDDLEDLVDVPAAIKRYSHGSIEVFDGVVTHNGEQLHNYAADKLLELMSAGFPVEPLLRFIDNLMQNPSKQAVDELYKYLEATKSPITSDGHFLAKKSVRANYMDHHSGTIRNMIGDKPSMLRNKVDDRRDVTCSYGLHFANLAYASGFGSTGRRIMTLKINPKDVVSIPSDYNNTKGRCCAYQVVAEDAGAFIEPVISSYDEPNYNSVCYNGNYDEDGDYVGMGNGQYDEDGDYVG